MSYVSHRVLSTVFGSTTLLLTSLGFAQPAPIDPTGTEPASPPPVQAAPNPTPPSMPAVEPAPSAPLPSEQSGAATSEPPTPPKTLAFPTHHDEGPEVLFKSDNGLKISGFGGVDVAYTRVAGENAALVCGGGAVLMSRTFSVGVTGCAMPTRISGETYSTVLHETGDRLEFAYGGLVAGYHFFPKRVYNLSLTAMVGGGAASIVNRHRDTWDDDDDFNHDYVKSVDPVFVAEPRLNGYLNLTRWARVGAFVGYRFVGGVDMRNLEGMSGPVAGGSLQFGWF